MRVLRCPREAKEVIAKRVVTIVDASLQACGTPVYLQFVYKHGTVTSRFLASTSSSPTRATTIATESRAGSALNAASNTRTVGSHASPDVLFR